MFTRDVHPGVKHGTVSVGDFNHSVLVRFKGDGCVCISCQLVNRYGL